MGGVGPAIQGQVTIPNWSHTVILTGVIVSMTVNTLVTGFIVFRIFKVVFQEVEKNLGATDGHKIWPIIFVLIESGMALLSIQLVRLATTTITTEGARDVHDIISGMHGMLNVIIISGIFTYFAAD